MRSAQTRCTTLCTKSPYRGEGQPRRTTKFQPEPGTQISERHVPKLRMRVRFPSSAPQRNPWWRERRGSRVKSNKTPQPVGVPQRGPVRVPSPAVSIRSRASAIARSRTAVACWQTRAASTLACPIRPISSRVLARDIAAKWLPVCRRSCTCTLPPARPGSLSKPHDAYQSELWCGSATSYLLEDKRCRLAWVRRLLSQGACLRSQGSALARPLTAVR